MSSSNLTPWLKKLVDAQSKGRVEFKTSPAGFGLGGFALCDFKSGDIVFEIPSDLILSSRSKCVTEDESIKKMLQQDSNITLETSLFVYMAKKTLLGNAEKYMFSLPNKPIHLLENELQGTNVGSQVGKDRVEMISQLEKIHALGDENHKFLTLEQLMIAKYNYNSRRYPLHFDVAGNNNNNNNSASSSVISNNKIAVVDIIVLKKKTKGIIILNRTATMTLMTYDGNAILKRYVAKMSSNGSMDNNNNNNVSIFSSMMVSKYEILLHGIAENFVYSYNIENGNLLGILNTKDSVECLGICKSPTYDLYATYGRSGTIRFWESDE